VSRPNRLPAPQIVERPPRPVLALGLVIFTLAGLLTGLFEVLFVPLRSGSTLIPISPILAILSNGLLPRLSRRINDDIAGAIAPVLGWGVAVFALALGRPEGDVFLSGGSNNDALVGYALMIAGFVAGVVAVIRTASVALAEGRADRRVESGSRR
jgi:hypothetical protein